MLPGEEVAVSDAELAASAKAEAEAQARAAQAAAKTAQTGDAAALPKPVAETPAAKAGAILRMDGMLLLGFGPRTPEAASLLYTALYGAEG